MMELELEPKDKEIRLIKTTMPTNAILTIQVMKVMSLDIKEQETNLTVSTTATNSILTMSATKEEKEETEDL